MIPEYRGYSRCYPLVTVCEKNAISRLVYALLNMSTLQDFTESIIVISVSSFLQSSRYIMHVVEYAVID